jgi:hypothetical protein
MHESERQYCKSFAIIAGFDTAWPVHGSLWKLVREAVVHSSRSARRRLNAGEPALQGIDKLTRLQYTDAGHQGGRHVKP